MSSSSFDTIGNTLRVQDHPLFEIFEILHKLYGNMQTAGVNCWRDGYSWHLSLQYMLPKYEGLFSKLEGQGHQVGKQLHTEMTTRKV